MTTYKVGSNTISTTQSIGISIERYTNQDYWTVRLYMQDAFSPTIMSYIASHMLSCSISIVDETGEITYTGVISHMESTAEYSFVNIMNCSVSYIGT